MSGGRNKMSENFPFNRFDFSVLIQTIKKNTHLLNIITDDETGIEFSNIQTVLTEELVDFLEHFTVVDNLAQRYSEQQYKKHPSLGVKSFQIEPLWVEISPKSVRIGYAGIHVNTDFTLTFSKINGQWALVD